MKKRVWKLSEETKEKIINALRRDGDKANALTIAEEIGVSTLSVYKIGRANGVRVKWKAPRHRKIVESSFTPEQWNRIIKLRELIKKGTYFDRFPIEGGLVDTLITRATETPITTH